MKDVLKSQFIIDICRITAEMYRAGWHERNAGNISVLLEENEVKQYLDLKWVLGTLSLSIEIKELAGKIFLVTGSGKYFKNIQYDPEKNLGIVRISEDGKRAELLWGFSDGGKFTSEFSAHLMCHAERLRIDSSHRVVMHSHPTDLVSMTYVHSIDEKEFSKTLWRSCVEAVLIFPNGIGILPWMLCGTNEIGTATAKKMREYNIVLWAMHGVFGVGKDLNEAFGLIETAEKAASIFIKTMPFKQILTTTDEQIKALADYWNIKCRTEWLN